MGAPVVNSTVIEPSLDQTPIPLLEYLNPDLSKAKARKSRSQKKKSAQIQDISTQPLVSNGANRLQEHQVMSETQVKPPKIKTPRKKSAKHQEAPAEVLPESPAQSVGSNGANHLQEQQVTSETQVKPAKIKKSRKKSAKHKEAPTVIEPSLDQTPIPLLEHLTPDLSKAKARKSRSPKKKSAQIQDISTQPLASHGANRLQEPQVTSETQVKPSKIKTPRKKSAKHREVSSGLL